MKKSLRHILLGVFLATMSLLLFLGLLFPVVQIDLSGVLGEYGKLLETYGMSYASENGFQLMSGRSGVVVFFEQMSVSAAEAAGVRFSAVSFTWLNIFSQVINILLLLLAAAMCIGSVIWLIMGEKENIAKLMAAVGLWAAFVYFAEGILYIIILNSEWKRLLETLSQSSSLFVGDIFRTLSFMPFILIALTEVAYWTVSFKVKDREKVAEIPKEENKTEEQGAEEQQDEKNFVSSLHELKGLYDSGVLTVQEWEEAKKKILDRL